MNFPVNKNTGQILLRYSVALVFFWFSINQFINPTYWTGFVPPFALQFGLSAENLVMANALFEVVFASLLILGLYTRISALLLSLHLIGISLSIGLNDPTGIRDMGLALATLSIFFLGKDRLCLDNRFNKHPDAEQT